MTNLGFVYKYPKDSYEVRHKDHKLLYELLDPWLINTLSMAIHLSIRDHGHSDPATFSKLCTIFFKSNKACKG